MVRNESKNDSNHKKLSIMPLNRKIYKNLIFFDVVLETLFSNDSKKGKTL